MARLEISQNGLTKIYGIDEIPSIPEQASLWPIDNEFALWWTPVDKRWRIMHFRGQIMHSEENFFTKEEALLFYRTHRPTWSCTPITGEDRFFK